MNKTLFKRCPQTAKKIFVKTFGCQMNEYDSDRLFCLAESMGYEQAESPDKADLIVINTCSVREKPQHKAISEIGWMHKRARAHPGVKLVLAGCVAQQLGDSILAKLPYLDLVIGTGAIGRFPELITRIENGERLADCTIEDDSLFGMPVSTMKNKASHGVTAFVSIMRGCNNYCSYCIVPYVRGPEKSRPSTDVIEEIEQLVKNDVREVTLLGQNVNSYGRGLDEKTDFVGLLKRVSDIKKLTRVRFTTSHPKDLSEDLINAFAHLPRLCSHIHLAVQSGSDDILREMNRKYLAEDYIQKVRKLRRIRPDMAITSDIIVGFCGETDEDFEKTLLLIRHVRFDNLFSFMYSTRPGTAAEKLADDVPLEIKKKRLEILQTLQKEITLEKNKALEGKRMEVLVEKPSRGGENRWSGRTSCFRTVHFDDSTVMPGDLVKVEIEEGFQNALVSVRVKEVQ